MSFSSRTVIHGVSYLVMNTVLFHHFYTLIRNIICIIFGIRCASTAVIMCVQIYADLSIYIHTQLHTYIYIYTYLHTYMYIYIELISM